MIAFASSGSTPDSQNFVGTVAWPIRRSMNRVSCWSQFRAVDAVVESESMTDAVSGA